MKKRIISILICLAMLLSFSITGFAAGFSDVGAEYSWAKDAIETLAEDKIISGYPEGTFKPGANITKEEAVSLFARALGSDDEANEGLLSFANDTYEALLDNYTSYAKKQAAFLLYKEVLTTEDVALYLATANKGQALKRYEAAVLIAKALGADEWLSENPDYTLDFEDAEDIPASAKAYVYYAADKGIMNGLSETTFGPNGSVTRAQVAVMIHRILTAMEYEYIPGVITEVDLNSVEIKMADGENIGYKVPRDVNIRVNGEATLVSDLKIGMDAVFTNSKGLLHSIDAIMILPDETITGAYKGKITDNTSTKVKIADLDTNVVTTYELAANAAIKYNSEAGSLASYKSGDFITAEVKNGLISVINGEPKNSTIEDLILEGIQFSPEVTLKLRHKRTDEEHVYTVDSNATLKRNNKEVSFTELAIGDTVDITLEYGLVSDVVAIGIDKTVKGTIEEIIISKNTSYISVNTGKDIVQYAVAKNAKITIDGKADEIYGLRLGASVEFSASSSTVTSLTVKSAIVSTELTGIVKLVNTSYGMVVLEVADASGDIVDTQIFVNDANILSASDGKVKTVRDLKEGQKLMVAGAINTGIFEANSIIILAQ